MVGPPKSKNNYNSHDSVAAQFLTEWLALISLVIGSLSKQMKRIKNRGTEVNMEKYIIKLINCNYRT